MTTLHAARPRTCSNDNGRAARRCSSLSISPCVIEPDHSLRQHFTRLRSNSDSVPMLPVRRPDVQAASWSLKADEQSKLPGTTRLEYDRWSSGSKAGSSEMNSSPLCSSTEAADLRGPKNDDSQPHSQFSRVSSPAAHDLDAVDLDYCYQSLDPNLDRSSPSIVLCPAPPNARFHRRRVSITSSPDGTTTVLVVDPPTSSSRPTHRRMSLTAGENDTQVLTIEEGDDPDPDPDHPHDASSSSSVSAMSDGDGSSRGGSRRRRRRDAAASSPLKARQPRRWSLSLSVPRSSKLTVEFTEPET